MKLKTLIISIICLLILSNAHSQTELWGMTSDGGEYGEGVIFKTDSNGENYSIMHSFFKYEGKRPKYTKLCEASNSKLYGMVYGVSGGFGNGLLFEYDPATNIYVNKLEFDGAQKGSQPLGSLIQADNGKLYGVTSKGGANDDGVLFEYDIETDSYAKKLDFDVIIYGSSPQGTLLQANNGKLYGLTRDGGLEGAGAIFEFDISTGIFTKLYDFDGDVNGGGPYGDLIQADNGKLYGMTSGGGANSKGVIFEYNIVTNNYEVIFEFYGGVWIYNGSNPLGSLMQATNGKLYGMTSRGGENGLGVIFHINPESHEYTKIYEFEGGYDGKYPTGNLIQTANGNLYGMTPEGGDQTKGILFGLNPETNEYTKKFAFDELIHGSEPFGTLLESSNGKLYGLTYSGGTFNTSHNGFGILFEYELDSGIFSKKFDFEGINDGGRPYGSLLEASNGKLYGMTTSGGMHGYYGVIFEFDPITNAYMKKFDFNGTNNGKLPFGTLTQSQNDKLYGMTASGGLYNYGVLFEYDIETQTFTKKVDFDGVNKGRNPNGSLIQASNGKLYGMTTKGGAYQNDGVLFEYDLESDEFTKKIDFNGDDFGGNPYGSLLEASNGKLYGMTSKGGGINEEGIIFEYDPLTETFIKLLNFWDEYFGKNPHGSLIQSSNGSLFGMTTYGGSEDDGLLFEFIPDSLFEKFDFEYWSKGSNPFGSVFQASNGKFYGLISDGGPDYRGVLFEYDLNGAPKYNIKVSFNEYIGASPRGDLIEIGITVGTIENAHDQEIKIFPNPFTTYTTIEYHLHRPAEVYIHIYNHLGKQVDLIQQFKSLGKQRIRWSPMGLPPGMYYFTLKAGDQVATGKLVLMN